MLVLLGLGLAMAHAADAPWSKGPFECYVVPALSSFQRLPDTIPVDGHLSSELRFVAAQGEFEPASFVIVPRQTVAKLELKPSDLTGPGGSVPASAVDIKIVKVWYQAGTGWYSYFGDSNRRELIPELLLNDETLVKVDEKAKENYLRVGGEYRWVSYPASKAEKAFNYITENVSDSPVLLPIALAKGQNKQIWVTIKVQQGLAGGIYRGKINLIADGQPAGAMEVALRVLPFALPKPKTYYNLDNPFLVSLYATSILGLSAQFKVPEDVTNQRQLAVYKDLLDHNVFNNRAEARVTGRDIVKDTAAFQREFDLFKQAGFETKPLISSAWAYPLGADEEKNFDLVKGRIDALSEMVKRVAGHDDIYFATWDEAGEARIKFMRQAAEYLKTKNLKLWATTAPGRHFELAGYVIDYANHGGYPRREIADQWHAVGAKVASYAGPHTGPENPDVFRRWEGLARYKAFYDGSYNYEYLTTMHPTLYEKQKTNVWNDFQGESFRRFNLVYPTINGVVDTLAWEGFREGIDDIRYATKLKQDAAAAIASGNTEAMLEAKKALVWLELMDAENTNLDTVRQ
ncbi:hypothetical protein BH09VER1_BH09VER1_08150 [soil metagenome]